VRITRRWRQASPRPANFRSAFVASTLHDSARALGFVEIEDLDGAALVAHFVSQGLAAPGKARGGHVVRMATG
jgi:hypothetical protein